MRLLIATTAFGLGVDCHSLPGRGDSNFLDDSIQESGRAGRDGSNSEVILYHIGGCYHGTEMKRYVENQSTCQRSVSFQNSLLSDCRSCDLCASICTCAENSWLCACAMYYK